MSYLGECTRTQRRQPTRALMFRCGICHDWMWPGSEFFGVHGMPGEVVCGECLRAYLDEDQDDDAE